MSGLPADADDCVDIVRFLAMDADEQLAVVSSSEAAPWVEGNPRPVGDLLANFGPYPGMFDDYPGHSPTRDAAHDLLMELITCANLVEIENGRPDADTFRKVEWSLLRRLARLTLDAFDLARQPFTRMFLFSY